jgi:hypothetical protein
MAASIVAIPVILFDYVTRAAPLAELLKILLFGQVILRNR